MLLRLVAHLVDDGRMHATHNIMINDGNSRFGLGPGLGLAITIMSYFVLYINISIYNCGDQSGKRQHLQNGLTGKKKK